MYMSLHVLSQSQRPALSSDLWATSHRRGRLYIACTAFFKVLKNSWTYSVECTLYYKDVQVMYEREVYIPGTSKTQFPVIFTPTT